MDAARHWAAQGKSSSNVAQAESAADPPEWQQALEDHEAQQELEDDRFPVWPENEEIVAVFIALRRCWRFDGMVGQYIGLHRPSIESTLRLMNIEQAKHRLIFEGLMIMEDAALPVLNRK